MNNFDDINGSMVFAKAKSKAEALGLEDKAKETAQGGKSVVVFFNGRYHLYLAPGSDPYQVRKDIEDFTNRPPEEKPKSEVKPKSSPQRDSKGHFVSKKHSVLEPDSSKKADPPKKKGFFGF